MRRVPGLAGLVQPDGDDRGVPGGGGRDASRGIRDIFIPADKGYGNAGFGSAVPPNGDLAFEVNLISMT